MSERIVKPTWLDLGPKATQADYDKIMQADAVQKVRMEMQEQLDYKERVNEKLRKENTDARRQVGRVQRSKEDAIDSMEINERHRAARYEAKIEELEARVRRLGGGGLEEDAEKQTRTLVDGGILIEWSVWTDAACYEQHLDACGETGLLMERWVLEAMQDRWIGCVRWQWNDSWHPRQRHNSDHTGHLRDEVMQRLKQRKVR